SALSETARGEEAPAAQGVSAPPAAEAQAAPREALKLFPLFSWESAKTPPRSRLYLYPLLFFYDRTEEGTFHAQLPLYAFSSDGVDRDLWLPPLLSRIGWGEEGRRRADVLFPLFHYSGDRSGFRVYSFPLVHVSANRPENRWLSLGILWSAAFDREKKKSTFSFLYPLSRFDNEPDGSRGENWFFPYIETYDEKSLSRFVLPAYYEYCSLLGGRTDWFFRLALPIHLSTGKPDDYFSTFLPLYVSSVASDRGWRLLAPIYLDVFSPASRTTHLFPLVSFRSVPSRSQVFVLGPLYVNERLYGLRRQRTGTAHHFLWPLFTFETRDDGYRTSAFPLFHASRRGNSRALLLSPFYYESESPRASARYVFPFWGRYDSPSLTREYYPLAAYIRSRARDEGGKIVSEGSYALWSLAASERDEARGIAHTRILPLGYWRTSRPGSSSTLAFPFYYGRRSEAEGEKTSLDLVLGNLFVSRSREKTAPAPGAEAREGPREGSWREVGVLWPLLRSYSSSAGDWSRWAIPFYADSKSDLRRTFALFPFFYRQVDSGPYEVNFWRHFFLANAEAWRGGYRVSAAQVLFDWKADAAADSYRLRILYPLLERSSSKDGYSFSLTPLCVFSRQGEVVENRIFPIYFQGATYRTDESGERRAIDRHFFLFPFYGHIVRRAYRDDYAPFPIVHLRTSADALRFELWPFLFFRDEPALFAVRLWPLHADEARVNAGDSWISRWLFLSKRFETREGARYRLDPFLFRLSAGPGEFGLGGLFELFAYSRTETASSFRTLPVFYGRWDEEGSVVAAFPFHYDRTRRHEPVGYGDPWRFFFLSNRLEGADGERHASFLWRAFERTDNPERPGFGEFGLLYRLFFVRRTEVSSSFAIRPFYSYYRNEADDETEQSFFFSVYRQRKAGGRVRRTLFWLLEF
ncbi:MAG: hypothetical protein ACUVYA_16935, partial [Planctomycetota bacterium]